MPEDLVHLLHGYTAFMDSIEAIPIRRDKLFHVGIGLMVWLACCVISQSPLRGTRGLTLTLAAELANEVIDFLAAAPHWSWGTRQGI